MTEMTPYSSVISLRSRRLRTIGIALLVVLLLMTLYGVFALMPAMKSATTIYQTAIEKARTQQAASPVETAKTLRHINRLMSVKLLIAHAYWLVCGLIAFAAMIVAWLDFREVARHYQTVRSAIWQNAAKIPPAGERPFEP